MSDPGAGLTNETLLDGPSGGSVGVAPATPETEDVPVESDIPVESDVVVEVVVESEAPAAPALVDDDSDGWAVDDGTELEAAEPAEEVDVGLLPEVDDDAAAAGVVVGVVVLEAPVVGAAVVVGAPVVAGAVVGAGAPPPSVTSLQE